MFGRTKSSTVKLMNEFSFAEYKGTLPAGEYVIKEDEERIEGVSWSAYRRIATFIQIPAIGRTGASRQLFKIAQEELAAIVEQDVELEVQKTLSGYVCQTGSSDV